MTSSRDRVGWVMTDLGDWPGRLPASPQPQGEARSPGGQRENEGENAVEDEAILDHQAQHPRGEAEAEEQTGCGRLAIEPRQHAEPEADHDPDHHHDGFVREQQTSGRVGDRNRRTGDPVRSIPVPGGRLLAPKHQPHAEVTGRYGDDPVVLADREERRDPAAKKHHRPDRQVPPRSVGQRSPGEASDPTDLGQDLVGSGDLFVHAKYFISQSTLLSNAAKGAGDRRAVLLGTDPKELAGGRLGAAEPRLGQADRRVSLHRGQDPRAAPATTSRGSCLR